MPSTRSFNDIKCIYMESGYVDYKICDRDFDCENCPFDKAIHDQGSSNKLIKSDIALEEKNPNRKFDNDREIPSDLLFSKNHVWIKKNDKEEYLLGVDHLAQNVVRRISTFQFPFVGSQVDKDKPILWVIGKWGVVSIPSPINCIIQEINSDVLLNINNFFFEDIYKLWLLKVKAIDQIHLSKLNQGRAHNKLLSEDLLTIKNFMGKVTDNPLLGTTMYNGGDLLINSPDHLINKEYVQLLKLIFNKK